MSKYLVLGGQVGHAAHAIPVLLRDDLQSRRATVGMEAPVATVTQQQEVVRTALTTHLFRDTGQ